MKLLADEQKREQHAEQDDVAPQQQAELAQEVLRAERVVQPHQAVHQQIQYAHAAHDDKVYNDCPEGSLFDIFTPWSVRAYFR